ncbi:MAG TPA: DUF1236 domain-containing protein [Hyphomicrobiaceae bacterium]|nr:DUF1236 domain-containing protein [Hyphomicrobiaceae bacterium]
MNRKLITAAAGVLLLGAGAAGLAQAQDGDQRGRGGGGGGGAGREAPRAAPERAAPRVERSQPRVERSQPRVERSQPRVERRAVERPQREQPRRVERQRERNTEQAERRQRVQQQQVERRERQQQQQVERRQREQTQRAERDQRDQRQRAERQQREQRQAAERQQRQQTQAQEKGRREGKQAGSPERAGPQQVNRIQASDEQRKGVRDRIFRERRVDRVRARDFRAKVVVGTYIESRHRRHLHRLTPAILAFAPIYAGYSYLVVDDEICIVDPATYYVVDVIPSSVEYAAGSSRPQLTLSAEEMAFIYASVPKDRPVDVRVRLALGAEVPNRVDLEPFPGGVIDRVPQVESYRFIVVEDDVVIVDPRDRAVALVITE